MKSIMRYAVGVGVVLGFVMTFSTNSYGQRGRGGGGGGGARPSMGHVGGGGGRPSMGGGGMQNMSRPSPNISRPSPNISRPNPSIGNGSRPSIGNVSQPNMPSQSVRPNVPNISGGANFNPGGGRPNVTLPSTRPSGGAGGAGGATRPSVKPPTNLMPTTRPSMPGNSTGQGNIGQGNRPTTLPGTVTRPGINPPSIGNLNRPSTLPGSVNRPGAGAGIDRPAIGGNNSIGGGNNRPVIGGGNNIIAGGNRPGGGNGLNVGNLNTGNVNIGNNVQIGGNTLGHKGGNFATTLPAWDRPGYGRPGWGLGGPGNGSWTGNWHDHCINHHHGWYNGCWNHGYWGSSWYRPVAWVSVGWGLNSLTSGWGYGVGYYNPYYAVPVNVGVVPYDYSQPVIVNNYMPAESSVVGTTFSSTTAKAAPLPLESPESLSKFDEGLAQFKSGNYAQALTSFDAALKQLPSDPVVHEVRALTLFALAQYTPAAASLNSLLSSAPGMDWTTMSGLYGSADAYTTQLRALEQFCKTNQNDAAAAFVLAYHYLVLGAKDNAVSALRAVVKLQPKDTTAKRMLDALMPPTPAAPTATVADASNPDATTDLVGNWKATVGDTSIALTITDASEFVWKATPKGQPAVELKGQVTADSDAIVLVNEAQGSMAGTVKSLGADQWQFKLEGAPADDAGLSFKRVN